MSRLIPGHDHPVLVEPVPSPPTGSSSALLEVDALWRDYLSQRSREHRDRLLVHYTPLVRSIAVRMAAGLRVYIDVADRVQSGVFGHIDAVERHDPHWCSKFESYAAQPDR